MAFVLAAAALGTTTFTYMVFNIFSTSNEENNENIETGDSDNIKMTDSCLITESLTPTSMSVIPTNRVISIKDSL